jgi:hypothetical protein
MRYEYAITLFGLIFALGFLWGDQCGVERARVFEASSRVSDYVRGDVDFVTEEDLSMVTPELREAALRR